MALNNFFRLHHRAPEPVPFSHIPSGTVQSSPHLVVRGSAPSSTCAANNNSGACEKPVSESSMTIPIAAGVAVPIGIAFILLIFLHRRHVRKLRREDANDRHKSLDFGAGMTNASTRGKKGKQAFQSGSALEKSLHRGRGMSMDIGNPYLLPPGLQSSHESLHSMSRTLHGAEDPYRPAITYFPGDAASIRSYSNSKVGGDDTSSMAGSSTRGYRPDGSTHNLLTNAQGMSRSQPPTPVLRNSIGSKLGEPRVQSPPAQAARTGLPSNPRAGLQPKSPPPERDSYTAKDGADLRRSNNYLAGFIHSRDPSIDQSQMIPQQTDGGQSFSNSAMQQTESRKSPPPMESITERVVPPPRNQSLPPRENQPVQYNAPQFQDQPKYYEDNNQSQYEHVQTVVPPSSGYPEYPSNAPEFSAYVQTPNDSLENPSYTSNEMDGYSSQTGLDVPDPNHDDRRLSILRPLPPDEPSDNPEQRANRIRSFYKEYFDESQPAKTYAPVPEVYYEDYGQEYQNDGTLFDPASGQFVVAQAPYSQPITRRAMTPPPRGPPRFQGSAHHQYNMSSPNPSVPSARSRAASSASTSARFGPQTRGAPRKALPPPGPLRTLPTPHLLQEDAFALPIDFAPPSNYKDRRVGRSESPQMQMRPYSPAVPVANPLASAFDELSSIPSPYLLRKSGAFTALDFAPPPRFKNSDAGSDAGSIRSGRSTGSAMSASQMHSIRAGAYRVSRIPKNVVGTRDEINNSLKPQWDLNR